MTYFLRFSIGYYALLIAFNLHASYTIAPYQASYNLYNMLYEQRLSSKDIDTYVGTILQTLHQQDSQKTFKSLSSSATKEAFIKSFDITVYSLLRLYSTKNLREFQSYNSLESFLQNSTRLLQGFRPAISSLSQQELHTIKIMYQELLDNIMVLQPRTGKKLHQKWQEFSNLMQDYAQAFDNQEKNYALDLVYQTYNKGLLPEVWHALINMLDYLSTQNIDGTPATPPASISSGITCCYTIAVHTLLIDQYILSILASHA
jgi:hypothetical protein